MSDLYRCSVCGLEIHLDNLTEHVLLHEEYSAFTYNETSKVIEPLLDSQDQKCHPVHNESIESSTDISAEFRTDFPIATTYHTPIVNFDSIPSCNQVSLYGNNIASNVENTSPQDEFIKVGNAYQTNSAFQAPPIQPSDEHARSVCLDSVGSLSGIRLITKAAESLSKTTDGDNLDDYNATDNIESNSNPISIQRPLNPGDIIDTIRLPYLGSSGSERLICECSIVFNRFVPETQQVNASPVQSVPQYRNFYTHTYDGTGGLSLLDIIDEDTESDNGHELADGDDIVKRSFRRVSRNGSITSGRYRAPTPRGSRAGYKMKVYEYNEPLVKSDVNKELPKKVIPELLKNPAVAKYLEKMSDDAVHISNNINGSNNEIEKIVHTSRGSGSDMLIAGNEMINKFTSREVVPANEHLEERNCGTMEASSTMETAPLVANSDENCKIKVECDNGTIKIIYTKPQVLIQNVDVAKVDQLSQDAENVIELDTHDITDSRTSDEIENSNDRNSDLINSGIDIEVHSSCPEGNLTLDTNIGTEENNSNEQHDIEEDISGIKSNESTLINGDMKERLENSICEEIETFEDELFYCMLCDVILPSKTKLRAHMDEHKQERPMKENIVKLDGTYAYHEDLKDCNDGDDFDEVDEEFEMDDSQQEVDDLENGLIIEKNRRRRGTKRGSNSAWFKESMLKKSRKRGSTRKAFICDNCGDSFDFVFDNLKHASACVSQSNQLKCFQGCGQVFKTTSELEYHKNFCSRRITYRARMDEIIEKIKKSAGDDFMDYIDPSMELDDESKLITCHVCEEVFTFEELCVHSANCKKKKSTVSDSKSEATYECQYCKRIHFSPDKNRFHELVCKKRPMQKCDYCEFSCKGTKPMSIHLVSQHNVNPFQCEFCPKAFKLAGSLKSHVKYTHTKETITCEYCGKSFCKQSRYRSHVSIQHEGFRYTCRFCDKPFKDKRTWLTHENSHKGAYDYACSVCKKTFNKASKYKDHMKAFHAIDGEAALVLNSTARDLRNKLCTNVCHVCGEKFPLRHAYSHHMVNAHGMTVDDSVTL